MAFISIMTLTVGQLILCLLSLVSSEELSSTNMMLHHNHNTSSPILPLILYKLPKEDCSQHVVNGEVELKKNKTIHKIKIEKDLSSSLKSSSPSLQLLTPPSSGLGLKLNPILSRAKRYIAFPEGSSFSVAVCATVGIIGNPRFNYMSFGLNWGVAYDLPNETWILNHLHGFKKQQVRPELLRRRARRDLYQEIEKTINNIGHNGRECMLRALCESKKYFTGTKMGMIGEMLRVVFSLPKQRLFSHEVRENNAIEQYDNAFRKAKSTDCSQQYMCSFSLLELAFGRYSDAPLEYFMSLQNK